MYIYFSVYEYLGSVGYNCVLLIRIKSGQGHIHMKHTLCGLFLIMYVYNYVYIFTPHTHTHTYIYIYIYVYMYVCIYVCIHTYTYMHIYLKGIQIKKINNKNVT